MLTFSRCNKAFAVQASLEGPGDLESLNQMSRFKSAVSELAELEPTEVTEYIQLSCVYILYI